MAVPLPRVLAHPNSGCSPLFLVLFCPTVEPNSLMFNQSQKRGDEDDPLPASQQILPSILLLLQRYLISFQIFTEEKIDILRWSLASILIVVFTFVEKG